MWEKWMANSLQGTKLFFSSWCNWKGFSPWVWGCQLYVLAGMFYWWRKPKYFEVCTCFETWYPGLSGGTLSPGVLKWDRKSQIHLKSLAIDSCDIWVCCIDYFWKLEISPMEMKDFCQELSSQLEALEAFCFCGSTVFFQLYKHQPGFSRIWLEHRAKRGMDQQQKHAPRLQGHGDDCHDDDDDDDDYYYYYYYHDDEYHDDDKAKVMMKITIKMKMKINIRIWTLNTMKKTTMRPAMQSFLDPEAPLIWWCTSVCGKDVNIVSTIRSMFVWILRSNKSIKNKSQNTDFWPPCWTTWSKSMLFQQKVSQWSFKVTLVLTSNLPSLKLTWHLKMDGWNTSFLLGWPIFRGYVSLQECASSLVGWWTY